MPVKEHYAEVKRNPAGWFLQDGAGGSNKKNTAVSLSTGPCMNRDRNEVALFLWENMENISY